MPRKLRFSKRRIRQPPPVAMLVQHALKVMSVLGKGHSERVYHRSMITCLNRAGVAHQSEVITPIYFLGDVVGFGRCDLMLGRIVVEFKANRTPPAHVSPQLDKYIESLHSTKKVWFRGVVINFNQKTGGIEVFEQPPRTD